jgi:3-hydroxyisobutyrate dehydrogenase-like beta-hydroxyacid dehydrogenase
LISVPVTPGALLFCAAAGLPAAIATRLMEAGNQATVWNRSLEKTKPLADAGAKIAPTPAAGLCSLEKSTSSVRHRESSDNPMLKAF